MREFSPSHSTDHRLLGKVTGNHCLGNSVGTAAPCKEEDEFWKNSTHSRHNATCQPLNTAQINRPDSWSSARWNCLSKPWAPGTGGEPGDKAGPFRTRVCRVAPWVSVQGELRVGNGVRRGGGTSLCSVVSRLHLWDQAAPLRPRCPSPHMFHSRHCQGCVCDK